jgi:hypothetical protein
VISARPSKLLVCSPGGTTIGVAAIPARVSAPISRAPCRPQTVSSLTMAVRRRFIRGAMASPAASIRPLPTRT